MLQIIPNFHIKVNTLLPPIFTTGTHPGNRSQERFFNRKCPGISTKKTRILAKHQASLYSDYLFFFLTHPSLLTQLASKICRIGRESFRAFDAEVRAQVTNQHPHWP